MNEDKAKADVKCALEEIGKAQEKLTKAIENARKQGVQIGESSSMEIGINCTDHGWSYCTKLNDKYNQLIGKVEILDNDRSHGHQISIHDAKFQLLDSHITSKFNELNENLNAMKTSIETLFKNYLEPLVNAFPHIYSNQ